MNKEELIKLLNTLKLPKDEYVIINTGSLVLRDFKEKAGDLDLHVTKECFYYIKNNFDIFDKDPERKLQDPFYAFKDYNAEFFVHDKNELIYDYIAGYKVQQLLPILDYKIERNALKDQEDIISICNYLNIELRDLYDENRNIANKRIRKHDKVPKGYYYNTVAIYMQNKKGDFLIQKRSYDKGGKWATTGGHPKSGEDSVHGLCSEVKEEIGIDIEINKLELIKSIKTDNDFFDLYYINMEVNIDDIVMQKEEVDDVKWASIKEIHDMIDDGSYKISHGLMFKDCMDFLENRNR